MIRAAGTTALVWLLTLGVCASAASAEPLSMTFTESRANVGVQLSDAALFEAPDTAAFEGQLDPGSGLIVEGDLAVPDFSTFITEPLDADVTVDFEIGIITGSFTQASGALLLTGEAGGTLKANGEECILSTTPSVLTLSTLGSSGGSTPRSGAPFAHGLTGAGAIAGQWNDMTATPVDPGPGGDTAACETVDDRIGGPGGVWLRQEGDVVPPSAPQLSGTDPASPNPSGTPRVLGAAEPGSTVRVYAGSNCVGAPVATASAAKLGSPGISVEVAEGVTAVFSASATDAAGNTSACSAPISYTRVKSTSGPKPSPACVVPKLVGKTLKAAKRRIKAAGCKLGEVRGPRPPDRRVPLVVKSSNPGAGARPADGEVDVRLGPKRGRAPRSS